MHLSRLFNDRGTSMINRLTRYVRRINYRSYANLALSRGILARQARSVDPSNPVSWEFSTFSQNGEDGIIEFLLDHIPRKNRYFIEIGASDGLENNSSYLAIVKKYSGMMIEANRNSSSRARDFLSPMNLGLKFLNATIGLNNVDMVRDESPYPDPDLLSLDVDSNDYHLVDAMFESGLCPKIVLVEYNAVFGPERKLTIRYKDSFDYLKAHESGLYFGASISALRTLFEKHGYNFVTVDSNGVNGIFIDPECFDPEFTSEIKGLLFTDNFYQLKQFGKSWQERFTIISHLEFDEIP